MIPIGVVAAFGVLTTLVGWFLVARIVFLLIRQAANVPSLDRVATARKVLTNSVAAGVLLALSLVIPTGGAPTKAALSVPIVWFSMPYPAWFAVVGVVMAVYRLTQTRTEITKDAEKARVKQAGAWAAFALVSLALFSGSPKMSSPFWEAAENKVEIFRGAITVDPTKLAIAAAFLAAAFYAMALLERSHRSRKATAVFFTHATLLLGTFVFGIPFAWLMVTSFKEDKDIVSAQGLDWNPKVAVTEPYFDKKHPEFETTYEGRPVRVQILSDTGGKAKVDILKPLAIRGTTFEISRSALTEVPRDIPLVDGNFKGQKIVGAVIEEMDDGSRRVKINEPAALKGTQYVALARDVVDQRKPGLRYMNYPEALDLLPLETNRGLVFLRNTMMIVVLNVVGTVISCTMVAYAFARLRFPGSKFLFALLLATMMLPGAVTMLPRFLLWKSLGGVDTLFPLWVGSFFAGAFNVFLLDQFFRTIPMELEDAAKIDGCGHLKTLVRVMVPQIKPALAAVSIFTAMGTWNDFQQPLIYINSPEKMPISYAVQLFQSGHSGEFALLMAFSSMALLPVLVLFFFAQRYFIEGVTLSGMGGR